MSATVLLLLPYPPQSRPWNPRNPIPSHLHHHRIIYTRYRRWDSNAESFRNQNFNFTSQYNDDDDEEEDDDDDNNFRRKRRRWWSDDLPPESDSGSGVLEEFIDNVWIFKVFRSFGWMLPFFIASILLATGPKAFLMALALPLGQSALSLAIEKLWGSKQKNPKRKAKTKKKPRAHSAGNVELEQEEEQKGTKKWKMGYQSWVAASDISADNSNQDEPGFGGWDELDRRREFDNGSGSMSARAAGKSRRTPLEKKGKLSKRVGKGEMPLLLRLLIAVFPFLGSWTKML